MSDVTYLFQYGSNMSPDRLRTKIYEFSGEFALPGTSLDLELIGTARLPRWRFVVDLISARQQSLVVNAIPGEEADEVWGVLYKLSKELIIRSDGERSVLDRIEGHRTERDPENYEPREVEVHINGKQEIAITYAGSDEARVRCKPKLSQARVKPDYARAVLDGAKEAELPQEYISRIAQALRRV